MDFKEFKHIPIGELETVKKCMSMPVKDAVPLMHCFCKKHGLSWDQGKILCSMVKRIDRA